MFYPFYTYTSCVYVGASVSYYVDEAGNGTVARLSLIDAFSSNPPNPYVRVELTKRKSFGQRSLDNRASEL